MRLFRAMLHAQLPQSPLSGCTWPHGVNSKAAYLTAVALLLVTANVWVLLQSTCRPCSITSSSVNHHNHPVWSSLFHRPADKSAHGTMPSTSDTGAAASSATHTATVPSPSPWKDASCQLQRTQYVPSASETQWFQNGRSWEPEYCRWYCT